MFVGEGRAESLEGGGVFVVDGRSECLEGEESMWW